MEELLNVIKSRGYWKVIIRPSVFDEKRISTLSECTRIIEESKVSLRGWDYPHYDREGRSNGLDWVESLTDSGAHKEMFRFFQSGQFIHLFSVREDWIMDDPWYGEKYRDVKPGSILGFINALYSGTEIFEFASRLVEKNILGGEIYIKVELCNNKGRKLTSFSFDRDLMGGLVSSLDVIPYEQIVSAKGLLGRSSELSLSYILWLFERFQWNNPHRDVLKEDQKKFLKKEA